MNSIVSLSRAARTVIVGLVLAVAAIAGLSLATAATAAPAYPPSDSCSVGATIGTTASIGSAAGITGSGFTPGATVTLTQNPGGTEVGSAKAGTDGSFETTVSLSSSNVTIRATSGSMTCATTELGTDSAAADRNTASGPRETASTGFQTLAATGIAVALLLGGFLLVMAGRRRSRV